MQSIKILNFQIPMKKILLFEKIENIKAASHFEHKLIDSIWQIMQLKRKAEKQYAVSLQAVNRQLERYVIQDNGFLTEIIKAFQSYITVIYHNQTVLIQGYDNEILSFLIQAKQSEMEQNLLNRVKFFDEKMNECQEKITNIKRTIRDNQTQKELIAHEVKLNSRIGGLTEQAKKVYAEKYKDISLIKQGNEQKLEAQVDGMMELSMEHNQILRDLDQYQTIYLQKKGSDVFDNFMRAFVLEVSFIRSMQFDVGNILQRIKDKQQEHKKVALQALKMRMKKQSSTVKTFIKDAYKKITNSFMLQIGQPFISKRIRDKWGRICEYYNSAL